MNNKLTPWLRPRREDLATPARSRVYAFPPLPLYMELDKIFDGIFNGFSSQGLSLKDEKQFGEALIRPSMDISGDDKQYFVSVELPGVDEKDLHVELEGDSLRISGEKKDEREVKSTDEGESGRNYFRIERSYGSFERVLTLPEDVDVTGISATHKDGVLTITMPRKEESRPENRKIAVNKN